MRRGAWVTVIAIMLLLGACADDPDDAGDSGNATGEPSGLAITSSIDPAACGWSTAGADLHRLHATACADTITADNVDRLAEAWFTPTRQEVTAAPAVDETQLYVGDWSGRFYAMARDTGTVVWSYDTPVHPNVYAGQITATPSLATIGDRPVVVVGGGRSVYAFDRRDGALIWTQTLGNTADPADTTEIEGGVAVADGKVVVGFDVHNEPTRRAGVVALDLSTGARVWYWDPEQDLPSGGCGDVWGSPAVDLAESEVFVGTANCAADESWGPYAEAIVSLDLGTGTPNWSYQPHEKGNDQDWDFAGAPNLFTIDGRDVVGLGNKDGWYYVVDRGTGELVWKAEAQRQDSDDDGFAFGGFIGATAVSGGVVVGGTAIGDCPCMHTFDAGDGSKRWQSQEPTGTYAATGATTELAFTGGVDQTLRAFRLTDGEVVWSKATRAVTSSGPALAGRDLYLGVGFREPGTDTPSAAAGVQAFRVFDEGEAPPEITTTSEPDTGPAVTAIEPVTHRCVGQVCVLDTRLKEPPAGTSPELTLEITPDPLDITVHASGLGPPEGWLRPGSAATEVGATAYGVFLSSRDDQPQLGSIVCTFGPDDDGCTATEIPKAADKFTRLTIVALADPDTPPTLQDGFDRFVTTEGLDPPLVPKG